jgi:hypothetical protein
MRERYAPAVESDAALENFVQQWAAQDLPAALEWATARPQGKQRDLLMERIAFVQAQTAPSDAERLVVALIPEGEAQTQALLTVSQQWGTHDHNSSP